DGPALGLRTPDPDAVEALVAARPGVFFTVAGYGIHPMVLLHVERASFDDLDEAVTDAWLCRAPRRLTGPFLDAAGGWGDTDRPGSRRGVDARRPPCDGPSGPPQG
ncbi:MAG: hypothetical protein LH469_12820, partial [Frankiaceae bacterium]|nr:hypothetical protein [Frankiaceae bacterium]